MRNGFVILLMTCLIFKGIYSQERRKPLPRLEKTNAQKIEVVTICRDVSFKVYDEKIWINNLSQNFGKNFKKLSKSSLSNKIEKYLIEKYTGDTDFPYWETNFKDYYESFKSSREYCPINHDSWDQAAIEPLLLSFIKIPSQSILCTNSLKSVSDSVSDQFIEFCNTRKNDYDSIKSKINGIKDFCDKNSIQLMFLHNFKVQKDNITVKRIINEIIDSLLAVPQKIFFGRKQGIYYDYNLVRGKKIGGDNYLDAEFVSYATDFINVIANTGIVENQYLARNMDSNSNLEFDKFIDEINEIDTEYQNSMHSISYISRVYDMRKANVIFSCLQLLITEPELYYEEITRCINSLYIIMGANIHNPEILKYTKILEAQFEIELAGKDLFGVNFNNSGNQILEEEFLSSNFFKDKSIEITPELRLTINLLKLKYELNKQYYEYPIKRDDNKILEKSRLKILIYFYNASIEIDSIESKFLQIQMRYNLVYLFQKYLISKNKIESAYKVGYYLLQYTEFNSKQFIPSQIDNIIFRHVQSCKYSGRNDESYFWRNATNHIDYSSFSNTSALLYQYRSETEKNDFEKLVVDSIKNNLNSLKWFWNGTSNNYRLSIINEMYEKNLKKKNFSQANLLKNFIDNKTFNKRQYEKYPSYSILKDHEQDKAVRIIYKTEVKDFRKSEKRMQKSNFKLTQLVVDKLTEIRYLDSLKTALNIAHKERKELNKTLKKTNYGLIAVVLLLFIAIGIVALFMNKAKKQEKIALKEKNKSITLKQGFGQLGHFGRNGLSTLIKRVGENGMMKNKGDIKLNLLAELEGLYDFMNKLSLDSTEDELIQSLSQEVDLAIQIIKIEYPEKYQGIELYRNIIIPDDLEEVNVPFLVVTNIIHNVFKHSDRDKPIKIKLEVVENKNKYRRIQIKDFTSEKKLKTYIIGSGTVFIKKSLRIYNESEIETNYVLSEWEGGASVEFNLKKQ